MILFQNVSGVVNGNKDYPFYSDRIHSLTQSINRWLPNLPAQRPLEKASLSPLKSTVQDEANLKTTELKKEIDRIEKEKEISSDGSVKILIERVNFLKDELKEVQAQKLEIQKDPLELSQLQKVAFGISLVSMAANLIAGEGSTLARYTSLAFQVGLSAYSYIQSPSMQTAIPMTIPFVFQGAQIALSYTPLRPLLPYLNMTLQGRAAYQMGIDIYKQLESSFIHLDRENYLTVLRNIFVCGVNGWNYGSSLLSSTKMAFGSKEEDSIEIAKKIICEGQETCDVESTAKIKSLYRRQALRFHPDKVDEADFVALTKAKETLLESLKSKPVEQVKNTRGFFDPLFDFFTVVDSFLKFPMAEATSLPDTDFSNAVSIGDRKFAHIHGDHFIGLTDLSGLSLPLAAKTLKENIVGLPYRIQSKVSTLIENIEYSPISLEEVPEASLKVANRLKNLKPGENFWLDAGWGSTADHSHSLLLRFTKRLKGSGYDISILNAGAGAQYHYLVFADTEHLAKDVIVSEIVEKRTSVKSYVCPFVKFENVSPEEVGIKNGKIDPFLFERLFNIKLSDDKEGEAEDEIYLKTFAALDHRRVADPRLDSDFFLVPLQRSGTCTWKTLVYAALRQFLGNQKDFEILKLHVKKNSFNEFCRLDQVSFSPDVKEICIQGGREILRKLSTLYGVFLYKQEVESHQKPVQSALSDLEVDNQIAFSGEELDSVIYKGKPRALGYRKPVEFIVPGKARSNLLPSYNTKPLNINTIRGLISELEKIKRDIVFSGGIDEKTERSTQNIREQIERLVEEIPRPLELVNSWNSATEEEIRESISLFLELLSSYSSYIDGSSYLLMHQNTAWALFATIHHLSTRLNSDLSTKYGIAYAPFKDLASSPIFAALCSKDLEFYHEILDYFKSLPQKNILFDLKETITREKVDVYTPMHPDEELLLSIAEAHQEISEVLEEAARLENKERKYIPASVLKRGLVFTLDKFFTSHPETAYLESLKQAAYQAQSFIYSFNEDVLFSRVDFLPFLMEKNKYDDHFSLGLRYQGKKGWTYDRLEKKFGISSRTENVGDFDEGLYESPEGKCLFSERSKEEENAIVLASNTLPSRLAALTCQKTIQSEKLVQYFTDNIQDLSDIKMQNLFLLSLFRSFSSSTPIHEAIKNPVFIKAISEFVQRGLRVFASGQRKPDINTSLFFVEVARRIKELDHTFDLSDLNERINQWLDRKDLTDNEIQALHLHRILQYTYQKDDLFRLKKEETIGSKQLEEIFVSWMLIYHYKNPIWHARQSKAEASRFVYSLAPVFQRLSPAFLNKCINKLFPDKARFLKPFVSQEVKMAQAKEIVKEILLSPLEVRHNTDFVRPDENIEEMITQSKEYKELIGTRQANIRKRFGNLFISTDEGEYRASIEGQRVIMEYSYYNNEIVSSFYKYIPQKEHPLTRDYFVFIHEGIGDAIFINKKTRAIEFKSLESFIEGNREYLEKLISNEISSFYELKDSEGEWIIDPLRQLIQRNGEEVIFNSSRDISRLKLYKDIFGEKKFPLTKQGNAFLFQDDQKRSFALIQKEKPTLYLLHEGEWCQLITELSEIAKIMPQALSIDYLIFHSPTKTLFLDKKDLSLVSKDFDQSLYQSVSDEFYSFVKPFEKASWILEKKKEDGSLEVELSRYSSLAGNRLRFIAESDGLAWLDHHQFKLKKTPNNLPLIGLCPNYLILQNGKKTKALVPLMPVKNSRSFAPSSNLDLADSELEFGRKYIEFDLRNGRPKALNSEGALFLTYLAIAEKNYAEATRLLKEDLNLKEDFFVSAESKQILLWILKHAISSYDVYPSKSAAALRASLLLLKEVIKPPMDANTMQEIKSDNPEIKRTEDPKKRAQIKQIIQIKEDILKVWGNYQEGIDEVQADLLLSKDEENELYYLASALGIDLYRPAGQLASAWFFEKTNQKGLISSAAYKMHTGKAEKFREVYEAFRQADPLDKAFLTIKYFEFLSSKEAREDFVNPLKAVLGNRWSSLGSNPKYPEGGIGNLEAEEWIKQFNGYSNLVPYNFYIPEHYSGKSNFLQLFNFNRESPRVEMSMAEALHKARASKKVQRFALPNVETVSCSFLENILSNSFSLEAKETCRQVSLDMLLERPALKQYQTAIKREREEFLQDYQRGIERNQMISKWVLKPGKSVTEVHKAIKNYMKDVHLPNIQSDKNELIALANKLPRDPSQRDLTQLLVGGYSLSKVNIKQLETAFLKGESEGYLTLNPHLSQEEVERLDSLIQEYLTQKIVLEQMKRALLEQDPNVLGEILSAQSAYSQPEYEPFRRQFLVYERRAGIIMREEQVSLIKKMSETNTNGVYKNMGLQLMMGGGKTTVIASNLLKLAAKPGRIPILIAPSEQFVSMRENFGNTQKKCFDQGVIPVHIQNRSEMTLYNLKWLQKQLEDVKTHGKVVLTTRETIEFLNLEYLSLLEKADLNEENKRQVIFSIIRDIKKVGDVFVDEVDLVLDPLHETNFPTGGKGRIKPYLIDMTRQIFRILISSEFNPRIRLKENQQASLTGREHTAILEGVLEKFFDDYKELNLKVSEKQSFLNFALGKEGDASFQEYIRLKAQSGTLEDQDFTDKMSLIKHLFSDVLPLTLTKSTGEQYGRVLDEELVGPYNGVDSPAFSEFGSQWEAMCYYFQTGVSKGVTVSQVKDLIKNFEVSASIEMEVRNINIEDTWEAKTFKEITGFTFLEVKDPTCLKEAVRKINRDPELLLLMQANTVAGLVGYYDSYLRSTSQNFVENFATFRSATGTPWIRSSFSDELQQHLLLDEGTEGKIADVFLQRSSPEKVHKTETTKPKEILANVLNGMHASRKGRLSGFIDAAGLFKDSTGLMVAKDVLEFYSSDKRIQSVLYFGRPTPKAPMTLMALKKGAVEPVVIGPIVVGSTQKKEIEKHGISPDTSFVYYGHKHSASTDIAQAKDAINVISVNHRMTRRTFMQAILRLRQYFKGQDIEMVFPAKEIEQFSKDSNTLPTHEEILMKLIDNQAIRVADLAFRSYKQKIDHTLRQKAMEELIDNDRMESDIEIFKRYKDLLLVTTDQNLYSQFGSPQSWDSSLKILENYRKEKESGYLRISGNTHKQRDVKNELDKIMESAKQCPYLPAKSKSVEQGNLGVGLEVSKEVDVDQEVDQELDQELQKELSLYQIAGESLPYKEIEWRDEDVKKGFKVASYSENSKSPLVYSLRELLSKRGSWKYLKNYFELFDENMMISHNFAHTSHKLAPVFSKQQKYADQILVVKEKGKLKAILISSLEADFFKKYLQSKSSSDDMWLVLASGHSLSKHSPEMNEELKDLLWQVNLFNGNIEALLQDQEKLLKKVSFNKSLYDDFLSLKVEQGSPKQKILFYRHFKERRAWEKVGLSIFHSALKANPHLIQKEIEESSLQSLGLSLDELLKQPFEVQEAFLRHEKELKKLHELKVDVNKFLKMPEEKVLDVLENINKVQLFIARGLKLETILQYMELSPSTVSV
jgi:hypothetical protein